MFKVAGRMRLHLHCSRTVSRFTLLLCALWLRGKRPSNLLSVLGCWPVNSGYQPWACYPFSRQVSPTCFAPPRVVTGSDPCPQGQPEQLAIPAPVSIGTPPGSPRSWSGDSSHNLPLQDIRIDASVGDDADSSSLIQHVIPHSPVRNSPLKPVTGRP